MNAKRIGFLVYPSMQALDLAGPMGAFAAAVIEDGGGRTARCYEPVTIGLDAGRLPPSRACASSRASRCATRRAWIRWRF